MKITLGFEKFYPLGGLLVLKYTFYGVKNAAKAFWNCCWGLWMSSDISEIAWIHACTTSGSCTLG